jgi:hypothetical protein
LIWVLFCLFIDGRILGQGAELWFGVGKMLAPFRETVKIWISLPHTRRRSSDTVRLR